MDHIGDHTVRLSPLPPEASGTARIAPGDTFRQWLKAHDARDRRRAVPLVFVATSGGGLRAAYWTDVVLSCALDDSTPSNCPKPASRGRKAAEQQRSVFAASGVSGGAVGLVEYVAHLKVGHDLENGGEAAAGALDDNWADHRLGDDYLGPTLAWMLFADIPKALARIHLGQDRAEVLERAWEQSWSGHTHLPEAGPGSTGALADSLRGLKPFEGRVPLLLLNSTDVRTDCRINVSVVDGAVESASPGDADCRSQVPFDQSVGRGAGWAFPVTRDFVDVLDCQDGRRDVRLSTAALLSARFPFVAPTGRVPACGNEHRVAISGVDGGYIDNTGVGAALDLWRFLRPDVEKHNATGTGPCIVPVFLQIDNDYAKETSGGEPALPGELLAPARVLLGVRAAHDASVRQAAAIAFGQSGFGDMAGATGAGGMEISRYIHVYPRASPDQHAPLGWVLSAPSMKALRGQLEQNQKEIGDVRHWFDADLTCHRT